jgi:hypothetical protein
MDPLTTLGRTLGFSFAAGVNLYATVAIMGLASRYQWVALPEQFRVFDNNWIIGAALAMYVVEFVADKIPWVDSIWDAVHTVIRPARRSSLSRRLDTRGLKCRRSRRWRVLLWPRAVTWPKPARAWRQTPVPSRFPTGS